MLNDKTTIFIYCDGKVVQGKISSEIINDELMASIENMIEKLNREELSDLYDEIDMKIRE